MRGITIRPAVAALALAATGCQPQRPPPPPLSFQNLPVAGPRTLAAAAGFDRCTNVDAVSIRCRRSGVTLFGAGPYEAGVDLVGREGRGGFRNLTMWHDRDQRALYAAIDAFARQGWTLCFTGTEQAGDQAIFSKPGEPVRVYMDISYYQKRRLRIFPAAAAPAASTPCRPNMGMGLFGLSDAR